jgi:hypothetical protein
VQLGEALRDGGAHLEHALDHRLEHVIAAVDELANARVEAARGHGSDLQAMRAKSTTDVVLDVDELAFEQPPVGEERGQALRV